MQAYNNLQHNKERIDSLQVLRGCAAIMVLLYHIRGYLIIIGNNNDTVFRIFTEFFSRGAFAFFSLSGFFMPITIGKKTKDFALRKFLRLHIPFLFSAITVMLVKYLLFSGNGMTSLQIIKALSLLPFGSTPYFLNVEWTLIYEMFFICLCSVLVNIQKEKYYYVFCFIWLGIILTYNILLSGRSEFLPTFGSIFTSFYNIFFIFGSFAYFLYDRIKLKSKVAIYASLILSISLIYFIEYYSKDNFLLANYKIYIFMILIGLIVFLVAQIKIQNYTKIVKLLIELGNCSYGIYLIHVPVISIFFVMLQDRFGIRLNSFIAIIVGIFALVVGCYFGKKDMLYQKLLKKILANNTNRWLVKGALACRILMLLVVLTVAYQTLINFYNNVMFLNK